MQERPPTRRCDAIEGDGAAELQGRRPLAKVLPGSQGLRAPYILRASSWWLGWLLARAPVKKAARMPSRAVGRRVQGEMIVPLIVGVPSILFPFSQFTIVEM
jgi:hypothetical protein